MSTNSASPSREQVLIVDDEALVAAFLTDLVEDLGLQVIGPVSSSEEAMEAAAREAPAVAIVDVSLGSGDGIALAAKLRESYGTAIIFLSGHSDVAANPAVQALEPVAVLSKPCLPNEIEAALSAARS